MTDCDNWYIPRDYAWNAAPVVIAPGVPTQTYESSMEDKLAEYQDGTCNKKKAYTLQQLSDWAEAFPAAYQYALFDPVSRNITSVKTTRTSAQKNTSDKIAALSNPDNFPCRKTIDGLPYDPDGSATFSFDNSVFYTECMQHYQQTMTTPMYNTCPDTRTFYDAFDKTMVTLDATPYLSQCQSNIQTAPPDPERMPLANGSCPYVRIDVNDTYYRVDYDDRNACILFPSYIPNNDGVDPSLAVTDVYKPLPELHNCPNYRCIDTDPSYLALVDASTLPVCKSDPTYVKGNDAKLQTCVNVPDDDDDDDNNDGNDTSNIALIVGVSAIVIAIGGAIAYGVYKSSTKN